MHNKLALVSAACLGGIAALLVAAGPPSAEKMHDAHPLAKLANADPNEMMAKWVASNESTPAHQMLDRFVGEWDVTMTMWMDPAGPPMESKGTASVTWKFPGKFIEENFAGDMMGMPFQGYSLMGFDNAKKQFVSLWIDSMGTGMSTMAGSADPSMKTIAMVGTMDEIMTGEMGKAFMMTTTIHSDDHHVAEMKEIIYGEPFTVMKLDYRRADRTARPAAQNAGQTRSCVCGHAESKADCACDHKGHTHAERVAHATGCAWTKTSGESACTCDI